MVNSRRPELRPSASAAFEVAHSKFAAAEEHADIAVIVVTYQSGDAVTPLIASLRAETADQSIRVVIADNASTDNTVDRAREHPDLIVIDNGSNPGYAGGINAAMAVAGDAEAFLILNPDLQVERHCLQRLLLKMREVGAGIVVPAISAPGGQQSLSLRYEPSVSRALGDALFGRIWPLRPHWLTETVRASSAYASAHPIDWATGAALLVNREAAKKIGAWDESFFLYSEETDYFRRARNAGYSVWYEPTARVIHAEGGSGRSADLVALTIVNAVRYAEKHEPRSAAIHRAVLALHELRRWGDPSHWLARTVLLDRRRWDRLPRRSAAATQSGRVTINHVLVTRFNLPSQGAESLIRAKEGWLQDRIELFERHTVPTVLAQTTSNFHWIIYFDIESPSWLVERLKPLAEAGVFTPLYRQAVLWTDLLDDARRVTGAAGDVLITTNLDNDDAIAVDFLERLQDAVSPGVREALFLSHGLIRSADRLFLRIDNNNAFCSVAEPWEGAITAWRDWHTLLGKHVPTRLIDGPPGWLQLIHERNVSNRVRGRLVSPTPYVHLFPGQLDDVPVPTPVTRLAEIAIRAPWRASREMIRASGKAVLFRLFGKKGLDRLRERLRSG